jgi:NADH-ubiquinone oxidoreductase chain 5
MVRVAACTKSAQIPFSAWLPAAIAAPTPVSALVHSSTLVTAGVYLIIRFHNPLIYTNLIKPLLIISVLTIFIAGISANFETDMKKIIALSTLSQLGLIIISIGLGLIKLAYFHILSHALFKALLFMCAGNVIHASIDNQDLRKLGIISKIIPVTTASINTANLALCGAPFMAGFYSKDLILEIINTQSYPMIIVLLGYLATALTVSYSLRIAFYTFSSTLSYPRTFNISDNHVFSTPALIPLSVLSVVGGAVIS